MNPYLLETPAVVSFSGGRTSGVRRSTHGITTDEQFADFILDRVVRSDVGCWEWQGTRVRGYGQVRWRGRARYVHREMYRMFCGPTPEAAEVMHGCDNPSCCRPDHLTIGTHAANMQDAARKGRIKSVGRAWATACLNGHPYPADTPVSRRGTRACPICKAARDGRHSAAKRRKRKCN